MKNNANREINKNIYEKICRNPACKKAFACDHGNRQYCSERCKRNFERDQKRKIRLQEAQSQREMQKNINIIDYYYKAGKTKVTMEDLKKKGFNANFYVNRVLSLKGEVIYSFGDYFLHRINDKEFTITKH